jgi:hypothetical protein
MNLEQYQDIWVNGSVISKGLRDCESRWQMLKPELDKWNREFTVLDFGANLGYFSLRMLSEYNCRVVAVESIYTPWLKTIVSQNKQSKLILLDKKFTLDDIRQLSDVEHFDLVLALSVMHHVEGGTYVEILEAMQTIGDVLIAEVAVEKEACGQYIVDQTFVPSYANILGTPESHLSKDRRTMFATYHSKTFLKKSYIGTPLNDTDIYIDSTYENKVGAKNGNRREWIAGINLKTWVEMGGCLPEIDDLINYCHKARPSFMNGDMIHGDIALHNVILQGDSVKFIDSLDVRRHVENDDEWFDKLITQLESLRK